MCHEKLVNTFIEINRKRNNGKNNLTGLDLTRLDSKAFRNDSDSNRIDSKNGLTRPSLACIFFILEIKV